MERNEYIPLIFAGIVIVAGVGVALFYGAGKPTNDAVAVNGPQTQVGEMAKSQSGYSVPASAPADWKARAEAPANWTYDSQKDAMRNQTSYYACTSTTNSMEFSYPYNGGSTANLCLRQSPKSGNDVYLSVSKGQFYCASYDGCTIHAKFDDGPVVALHANEASGGDTSVIFITGYKRFSERLKKAKHLFIEAEFYQDGRRQMEFDVQGYAGVRPAAGK